MSSEYIHEGPSKSDVPVDQILVTRECDDPQLPIFKVGGSVTHRTLADYRSPDDVLGFGASAANLLLNLSECVYADSTGISWLIQLHRRCEAMQGKLVIYGLTPLVENMLVLLSMQLVLHIAEDEQAARSIVAGD